MQLSEQQVQVVDDGVSGTGHTVVNASAGTGKTTTVAARVHRIREAARVNQAPVSILATSFARSAVHALRTKIAWGQADVYSFHQIGWSWIRGAYPHIMFDKSKGRELARLACINEGLVIPSKRKKGSVRADPDWAFAVYDLCSYAKNTLASSSDDLVELVNRHGFDLKLRRQTKVANIARTSPRRS